VFILGMTLQTANLLPTGSAVQIAAGALLDLNGTNQSLAALSGDSGSAIVLGGATLTVGSDNSSTTFAGTIYGNGSVTKVGSGVLALSGADAHNGTTSVADGTLQAGAIDALSASSTYTVDSVATLDIDGFGQTIGSLSGGGEITNSSATPATLSVGGDNTNTLFSGTIENGGSQLSLDKTGSGTLTFTGPNIYTGPTVITAGVLEVDDYVNYSPVTIDSGTTLQGNGGTGPVTNLGGTYSALLYDVTIGNALLQRSGADSPNSGELSLADGQNGEVLALSAADAALRVLHGTASVGGSDYALSGPASQGVFSYRSDLVVDGSGGGVVYSGSAIIFDLGGSGGAVDYFPITDSVDSWNPVAEDQAYTLGVGGTMTVIATTPDTAYVPTLSIASVDGSTDRTATSCNGTLTWNPDGSFSYTPNVGFHGTDKFTYVLTNGSTNSNPATLTFQVLLPSASLADGANGNGGVILASDGIAADDADSDHLDQLQLNVLDSVFASLPSSLSGWTLDLQVLDALGAAKIWSSTSKTTELDLNSSGTPTGAVSWNLAGGLASVPASVWLEFDAAGNYVAQLTLVSPLGSVVETSQVQPEVLHGMLIAPEILDNKATQSLPRSLQDSQGTFVPLNNEDDSYALTAGNQLIPDTAQVGAIANDAFLTPVAIQGNVGDSYTLEFPSNIHVWKNNDRTEPINPGTVLAVGTNGFLRVYIEGVADGVGTLQLLWNDPGNEFVAVDQLKITVFEIDGAQDVPGSSTDSYSAKGALGGVDANGDLISGFMQPYGGNYSSGNNGVAGFATAKITWFNQAEPGEVRFVAAPDYVWDYTVNVVQVTVTDPTLTTPGTVGQPSLPGAGAPLPLVTSSLGAGAAMTASANVKMLARVVDYLGTVQNRGINFMDVGFIQNSTSRITNGVYGTGGPILRNKAQRIKGTLLDEITTPPRGQPSTFIPPWYDSTVSTAAGVSGRHGLFFAKRTTTAVNIALVTTDTPRMPLPPKKDGDAALTEFNLVWNFVMFVAAATSDNTALERGNNQVFTAFAFGTWTFNGSGTMVVTGGNAVWTKIDGITGDSGTGMTTNLAGAPSIKTTGSPFNTPLRGATNDWTP
jgi:autotransporter-associated beta strand protein